MSSPDRFVNPEAFPRELTALPHWVVFAQVPQPDGKKPRKIPYTPGTDRQARVNDPRTCRPYAAAIADFTRTGRLPSVLLTSEMGLTLIDRDGGIDAALVEDFDSYSERSINGGLHILVRGRPPQNFVAPPGLEVYPRDGNRFLLITGNIIGARDTIEERTALLAERFPPAAPIAPLPSTPLTMDDDELLARAFAAANGTDLERLLAGDLNGHGNDHSAADLAAASKLAFWTQDQEQIKRIIGASTLGAREKWQKRRDYQDRTVSKALRRSEFYTPPAPITRPSTTERPPESMGDPCSPVRDEIAALRAENAELRRQLAAAERRAAERDQFEKLYMTTARVLRNPNLRPGEKTTGLSLIVEMEDARLRGKMDDDGWAEVPLDRLAERSNCSAGTAGKHVDRLATAGVIESETKPIPGKRYWRRVARFPTTETDDDTAPTLTDRLATLANAAPERDDKGWGGDHRCTDHPNAGTIITTTTVRTCAHPGCGQIIGKPVTRRRPVRPLVTQDAALGDPETIEPSAEPQLVVQDAALVPEWPALLVIKNGDQPFSTAAEERAELLVPQDDGLGPRIAPRPGGILERVRDPDAPRAAPPFLTVPQAGEPGRDKWTG